MSGEVEAELVQGGGTEVALVLVADDIRDRLRNGCSSESAWSCTRSLWSKLSSDESSTKETLLRRLLCDRWLRWTPAEVVCARFRPSWNCEDSWPLGL